MIPNLTNLEILRYYLSHAPKIHRSGGELRGPCPIHRGQRDSFAVNLETGCWYCHSTCDRGGGIVEFEMVLHGLDQESAHAAVCDFLGRQNGNGRRIVKTYPYVDEQGTLLFECVRFEPKGFAQRRPNGSGGWIWNLKDVRRVLYRLPDLMLAQIVFICEGEKDADALVALGVVATCNPMGAGKWRSEYVEYLRNKEVFTIPDDDQPGREHAATVVKSLTDVASFVQLLPLPGAKDVSEWIERGGTLEMLIELTKQAHVNGHAASAPADPEARDAPAPASSAFRQTDEGVHYHDPDPEKEPLRICGPLDVAAFTRDAHSDGWGRLLRWSDAEGRPHEWAMPMSLLAGDGSEYRARLLDGGLFLAPGRKARELLTVYLQTVRPEARALCVSRVGWHDGVFVLPGASIGPDGTERILFQTLYETEHYFRVAGAAEDWRSNVGRFCSGNSRLVLSTSCGFAGPLLRVVGTESGGFHFRGATSVGKTTGLVVGGSALGGGGRNGFVQSWRATANGLEAIAELHNDTTLFLDELGQMDSREAAETAYLLGNGSGKARMTRNIGARKKLSWSLLFVSAGEITLADHSQTAGKRTKGGAEVRLINIEADAGAGMGLFEDIHGAESPDAFARQLTDAAKRYYGAPLRTYLDFLAKNRAATEKAIRNFQMGFVVRHVPEGASGEVFRAAQRFGLVAAAGELATDIGITGWEPEEATDAAARCLKSWIDDRGTNGGADTEAAVNQVRRFLEAHGASRFQTIRYPDVEVGIDSPDENQLVINRAGFRRKTSGGESEFLIFREIFKAEICQGFDYRMVARALDERKFLDRQPPDLTRQVRLPGNLGLIRVFSVRASILEG